MEQQLGFGVGFITHARSVNNRMPAYVCQRVADVLSTTLGQALREAKILLVGIAYKAGVNDPRESPALEIAQRMRASGAEISYHDPRIDTVTIDGEDLHSVPLTPERLAAADCVVLLSAGSGVDIDEITSTATLVFDACGVTRSNRSDTVVLL